MESSRLCIRTKKTTAEFLKVQYGWKISWLVGNTMAADDILMLTRIKALIVPQGPESRDFVPRLQAFRRHVLRSEAMTAFLMEGCEHAGAMGFVALLELLELLEAHGPVPFP